MSKLFTMKAIKRVLMSGAFMAALAVLVGIQAAKLNAQEQRLWSIVEHFEYEDGFEFDYVLQRGVAARDLGAALAECGSSHSVGSVVRYHCYAVPE
jgi:hypothetical protein